MPLLDRASDRYFSLRERADSAAAFALRVGRRANAYNPGPLPRKLGLDDKLAIMRRYVLGSSCADERQAYITLARMAPSQGDFDPRGSPYGGAFLYPLGALLFALDAVSILTLESETGHYLRVPEDARNMYLVGRLFALVSFLGVGILLALIGVAMRAPRVGTIAMLTWLISSQPLNQALVTKPHVWTAFWVTLAILLLYNAYASNQPKNLLFSGVAMGVGAGSSITALAMLLSYPALSGLSPWRRPQMTRLLMAALSGVVIFGLTNPYVFTNPIIYLVTAGHYATGAGYNYALPSLSKLSVALGDMFLRGLAFPLGVLGLMGLVGCLVNRDGFWKRIGVLWIFIFACTGLFTGETRYVLFLMPLVCLYVGLACEHLLRILPALGFGRATLVLAFLPGACFGALTIYEFIYDEEWLKDTAVWIADEGLQRGVSIGLLDHPEPQIIPALPFLRLEIVNIKEQGELVEAPGVVVVGNSVQQRDDWERSVLGARYRLTRILGYRRSYDWLVGFRMRSEARTAAWIYELKTCSNQRGRSCEGTSAVDDASMPGLGSGPGDRLESGRGPWF